jgi:hypothetical protein
MARDPLICEVPDKLAARLGHQLIYSVGWELGHREKTAITAVHRDAWQIAVDERGEVRQLRADDACADLRCAHRGCWIEEARVAGLTLLLRCGRAGDQLAAWPASMLTTQPAMALTGELRANDL